MIKAFFWRSCILTFLLTSCSSSDDSSNNPSNSIQITISDFSTSLDENPTTGLVIGTIQASTNQGALEFSLLNEDPAGAIQITNTGVISVSNDELFDFESRQSITATVEARNGDVSENAIVTISILDILENVYEGTVVLKSQQEVNEFGSQDYDHITGDLQIYPILGGLTDVNDLSPLNALKKIDGSLFINRCPVLTSLDGLENLSFIGEQLKITQNEKLSDMSSLSQIDTIPIMLFLAELPALQSLSGLENVTAIDNGLRLQDIGVQNLDDLSNLNSLSGYITIIYNDYLTNVDGLSNAIGSIETSITVHDNASLESLSGLSNLSGDMMEGQISIVRNPMLSNLDGLQGMSTCVHLVIYQNESLVSIDGLSGLSSVESLGITENEVLTNIDGISNITSVLDGIGIQANPLLENIDGLQGVTTPINHLGISHNPSLSNLDGISGVPEVQLSIYVTYNDALENFCGLESMALNSDPGLTFTISDNLFNPTRDDISNGNCSL